MGCLDSGVRHEDALDGSVHVTPNSVRQPTWGPLIAWRSLEVTILLLPGDGIGPEVVEKPARPRRHCQGVSVTSSRSKTDDIAGLRVTDTASPLPAATLELAKRSNAVARGSWWTEVETTRPPRHDPKWDVPHSNPDSICTANLRPGALLCWLSTPLPWPRTPRGRPDISWCAELTVGLY